MPTTYDDLLESYPEDLEAALHASSDARERLSEISPGLEFIVKDLDKWPAGDTITVAFLGGSDDLHEAIATTAQQISDVCGIHLDFGLDPETNSFRRWTLQDTDYRADIRVSFDQNGYWSLVGMASIDRNLTPPHLSAGGAPHQRSLNLGGFDRSLPAGWRRTVLHEFLHALAFTHEHQNPRSECQTEFRWDDDPGYVRTPDPTGRFVPDVEGRRPGIYTYLSGAPNHWDRQRVDHNLRTGDGDDVTAGPFDPESVMLYRFDPLFYRSDPSPCAPTSEGDELSDGDIRGLRLMYPIAGAATDPRIDDALAARETLSQLAGLESIDLTEGSEGIALRLDRVCAAR